MNIEIRNNVIGNKEINSVSARELHSFLEVGTEFSHWIKRMCEYGFTENDDFLTIVKKDGRQILKEYIISIDMAKEISMLQRSDKGKEARKYFIECEKQLKENKPKELSRLEILEIAIESEKKLIEANTQLEEQKPKVSYYDDLVSIGNSTNFRDTAKTLGVNQNDFINFLLDKKYIYRGADNVLLPYSQYTPKWFVLKEWKNIFKSGVRTLVTVEGKNHFSMILNKSVL